MMEKLFYGTNEFKKIAARIAFYNINKKVPTEQTPIVYDIANQRVVYAPDGGYAGHYKIFDWMDEKGWDIPPDNQQAHGYYWPKTQSFEWYGKPYYTPNPNLEQAFRSGIQKSIPLSKQPKPITLCRGFKWAAPSYTDIKPTDTTDARPVIYWVNEDTIYLGRPGGMHYEIYEIMEDDGFDPSGHTGQEVHGYWRGPDRNFTWYEPGAYGYEANRLPEGDEEARIKATIMAVFDGKMQPTAATKLRVQAAMLPLVIDDTGDDHGGGVAWIWDGDELHVSNRQAYHYEVEGANTIMLGRFMPDTGQVLFYKQNDLNYHERIPWTELHDDIVETLRAHQHEILDDDVELSGFEQSAIGGQGYNDPNDVWWRSV